MTQETADRMFETADPWALFAAWLAEARAAEPADAEAMCLATVDESGMPNVRVMLMKGFD
jgi:pyridoxamine 5'-phosphate oxidase